MQRARIADVKLMAKRRWSVGVGLEWLGAGEELLSKRGTIDDQWGI
jgi:hypothetical protein